MQRCVEITMKLENGLGENTGYDSTVISGHLICTNMCQQFDRNIPMWLAGDVLYDNQAQIPGNGPDLTKVRYICIKFKVCYIIYAKC